MSMSEESQMVRTDWSGMTLGERIRHLEVEGYVVLPEMIDPDRLARLQAQTCELPTTAVDYSVHQQVCPDVQFSGGEITELIANPPMIAFLRELFGDEIIMMRYGYARSEPGHPGISLHCDGQPWASEIFGPEHSCPRLVRVLYYLDDLTEEVSPFRVVPRSHLSFHADGNPYLRYSQHPEEVMVTCRAGSAVLIHPNVFHGNFPNVGKRSRELLAISYRPAWAGPAGEVPAWDETELEKLSDAAREFFGDPNRRIWFPEGGNKPADMKCAAAGISPNRWNRAR